MERQERKILELEYESSELRDKICKLECLVRDLNGGEPIDAGIHTVPRLTSAGSGGGLSRESGSEMEGPRSRIEEMYMYLSPPTHLGNEHEHSGMESEIGGNSEFIDRLFPGLGLGLIPPLPNPVEVEDQPIISQSIPIPIPQFIGPIIDPNPIPDTELELVNTRTDTEEGSDIDYDLYLLTPLDSDSDGEGTATPISSYLELTPTPSLNKIFELPPTTTSVSSSHSSFHRSDSNIAIIPDPGIFPDRSLTISQNSSDTSSAVSTSGIATTRTHEEDEGCTETDDHLEGLGPRSHLDGFVDWAKTALELVEKEGEGSKELDQLEWTWGLIREFQNCLDAIPSVDEIDCEDIDATSRL
jgi:hypothetical protein